MTAQHLYQIDEIHPGLQEQVGNKAFYLGLLAQAGYPVVPGVVVSSSMFRSFWQQIQWNAPLFSDFPHSSLHIDVENHQQLRAIAQQLQHAICTAPLPNDWLQAIEQSTQSLKGTLLILRPSLALYGTPNPTLDARIQGLLPTQTCKPEMEAIAQALKSTWAGLFRARSLFYWKRLGISLQPFYSVYWCNRSIPPKRLDAFALQRVINSKSRRFGGWAKPSQPERPFQIGIG